MLKDVKVKYIAHPEYVARLPLWHRVITKYLPFMVQACPFGSVHWRWERICVCGFGIPDEPIDYFASEDEECGECEHGAEEHGEHGEHGAHGALHHGGIFDLLNQVEWQPCPACAPDITEKSGFFHLDTEERILIENWRQMRADILDHYGDDLPYAYEVDVKLGEIEYTLLSKAQGLGVLSIKDANCPPPDPSKPN